MHDTAIFLHPVWNLTLPLLFSTQIRCEYFRDSSIIKFIMHIIHCACAKSSHFYLRSKIWRHHRVPRPRFSIRRENFGDSQIFEADIGSKWPEIEERVVRYWPLTNSFNLFPLRVVNSVSILGENRSKYATVRGRTEGHTHKYTHRRTHPICYSCGADYNSKNSNLMVFWLQQGSFFATSVKIERSKYGTIQGFI